MARLTTALNSLKPQVEQREQFVQVSGLNRIVGGELGQALEGGADCGLGFLEVGQEFRLRGEQIAALGALGATDLQQ